MDELEVKLAKLKRRGEQAASEHAKAVAAQELARKRVTEAVQALRDEFGVTSMTDAKALYEKLTLEVQQKLETAESLLAMVENA